MKLIYSLLIFLMPIVALSDEKISLFEIDKQNNVIATKDSDKTLGLILNQESLNYIENNKNEAILVSLPFFDQKIEITLIPNNTFFKNLKVYSSDENSRKPITVDPSIISFKILYADESIGVINFFNNSILGSFKLENRQYEISTFNNQYILFEASNSINPSNFECALIEESFNPINPPSSQTETDISNSVCIELAVEIDHYTRQTFTNDLEATDWALAIFAGVSQLYEAQTNASVSVDYINIWNTSDPFDTPTLNDDAQAMLSELASYWVDYNTDIDRDLVHLLSKRSNTGTGGIAYLDVLGDTHYGYGFSSDLNNSLDYSFPNPTYTWNLNVCTHELGHNIGSDHTHWCGWSADETYDFEGGGIDNCGVLSGSSDDCDPSAPFPENGIGSIMSYCHVGGNGITLEFNDIIVSQALNPNISSADCLTACVFEGCTDNLALNYDPSASIDDNSCCYVSGCTDESALNFDIDACINNGSCTYPTFGCMDSTASNYNHLATDENGSCCYSPLFTLNMNDSYGDGWNNNNLTLTSENNTVYGPFTFFNDFFEQDSFCLPNGCYTVECDGGNWQSEISWSLVDVNDSIIISGDCPFSETICINSIIYGCTNPTAFNFDSEANQDDGSCIIYGCTNDNAENYNANANEDDGSCILLGCTNADADNYDLNANVDDGSCIIYGCTDETAENYNTIATTDDGSCEYCEYTVNLSIFTDCWGQETSWSIVDEELNIIQSVETHSYDDQTTYNYDICLNEGCYTFNIQDTYGDGLNGSQWSSCNIDGSYSITNLENNNSLVEMTEPNFGLEISHTFCVGTLISGCTNSQADNFNPDATEDDGSCIIYGCTDSQSQNFNPNATDDDGSCIIYGCTDSQAQNFNPNANVDDGSCIIYGCTDSQAQNFNPYANVDDGSCIIYGCTDSQAQNFNPYANVDDGSCIIYGCTDSQAQNFDPNANVDDGSCIIYGCTDSQAQNFNPYANVDDESCIIYGCTDSQAQNFDPNANVNDGSCMIYGCTDELACNFNFEANVEDESCLYLNVEFDVIENLCPGAETGVINTVITHGTPPYSYTWNNGETSSNLTALASGEYSVTVMDSFGCWSQDTVTLNSPDYSIDDVQAEICYVSVDDTSGSNIININPIQSENIYGYSIFKEALSDEYIQIGTVESSIDNFVDINSNPMMNSSRYRIKAIDFCLNSSPFSDFHQTIHLSINLGFNNSINLSWNHYIGFEVSSYMVYRGTDHQNLEFVAFVSGNQNTYTDINPPIETSVYQVRLVTPICSSNEILPNANIALFEDTLKSNFVTHDDMADEFAVNIISNEPSCSSCEDGSIIALPYGGNSPYTVVWSNSIYTYDNINLGAGTYTLYITDNSGSLITETIILEHTDKPGCTDPAADNYDPTATEDDNSCIYCNNFSLEIIEVTNTSSIGASDGSIQASATNGSNNYNIVIYSDEVQQNPFALSAGIYTVYISDIDFGCEASANFTIYDPQIEQDPCELIPSGLFVDNIIHNRVVFNWSAPTSAPSYYMIRYRELGTDSWTVMTAGSVNSNEFTGTSRSRYFMQPATTYEWSMRARVLNEDGSTNCQSPWSTSSQYTTLETCANLENLSTSTEANWVTFNADAADASWGVWQSKGKIREIGTNSFRYLNGDSNGNVSVLKGNFSPSTNYEWHTKAWCTANVDELGNSDPQYHSGWGEFSIFTTMALCDKMPLNLATSTNGAQTAITMSWDTPQNGAPDHYFLELNNDNTGQQWQWNNISGTSNSKTKFGLSAGQYSWRIRGACGSNGTSWATIFSQPIEYNLGGARIENAALENIAIYPNPSSNVFNIDLYSISQTEISVYNVLGESIYFEQYKGDGAFNTQIDLSNYSKGIYNLTIKISDKISHHKLILQ